MNKTLYILLAVITLAGCKEEDQLKTNPVVADIGVFEGCDVKYVNRGYESLSFYMAKCGNTTTVTNRTGGKHSRTRTVITQEIEALQTELKTVSKEEALSKLTPEERKVLGIRNE